MNKQYLPDSRSAANPLLQKRSLPLLASLLILAGCSQQPATTVTTKTIPSNTTTSTTTTMTINKTTTPSATTSTQAQTTTSTAVSSTQQVIIANYTFSPAKITVKPGTTVTWTNQDTISHTITADLVTTDTPNFGSATLAQGDSYSYTFATAGTFNYHCSIHPMMKASVTVAL